MVPKIRILRNPVGYRNALFRYLRLVQVCLNIYARHTRAAGHDYVTEARVAKVREDTELAKIRQRKLETDAVLQDLKVEKLRQELGYAADPDIRASNQHRREGKAWD